MSELVVDYVFNGNNLANPDGSLSVSFVNCAVIPGPGATTLGDFPNALNLGSVGNAQVNLPLDQLNTQKFCVRTVVKVDAPVVGRQNLVESAAIPLSIYLDAIPGNSAFQAVVSVAPASHGWNIASTRYAMPLEVGQWYTIDLIYDADTLGVAINGNVLSVQAFPNGTINLSTLATLFIGTWIDGTKWHFNGSMAALQLHNGIPSDLEALLDERRSSPEWFITYRNIQLRAILNLGSKIGGITYNTAISSYIQTYTGSLLMYTPGAGSAYEMHGEIFKAYQAMPDKAVLGFLVTDEMNAAVNGARKSLFSKGGIYWSGGTGAIPILGRIYVDYEALGEARAIGLPTTKETIITGGKEQVFQGARMYLKNNGTRAFEAHGDILAKFLATGGVGTWGFPITDEYGVMRGNTVLGRASEFEQCTIYWQSGVGAFEVHGAIRDTYHSLGGPIGSLGFPTSDEQNVPGASAPARANSFQHGSLLWFGGNVIVCRPYKIFVGRFDTQNNEGIGMGQNDLYFRITIEDNGHQLLNVRYPSSGDFDGHDVLEFNQQLPIVITPNNIRSSINITFDIWESDGGALGLSR